MLPLHTTTTPFWLKYKNKKYRMLLHLPKKKKTALVYKRNANLY